MNDFLAIIDATTYFPETKPLTDYRQIGALPILGDYRMIDFVLSSLTNSGCKSIALYPSRSHRSLRDHISDGKAWNLNRRKDGLFLFPCTYLDLNQELFLSYKRIKDHIEYLNRSTQKYVIIGHTYGIFNIDFAAIIEEHDKTNADITVLKKDGRPIRFYVLSLKLLKHLLNTFESHNENDIAHTILNRYELRIMDVDVKEDVTLIMSMNDYYQNSMDFLQGSQKIAKHFLNPQKPIFSKTNNSAPSFYDPVSNVKKSIVANGCEIKGEVFSSIIFRKVKIDFDSKIKNSIIFQGTQIGKNCTLEYVIVDKEAVIMDNVTLIGTYEFPIYVHKREVKK